MWMYRGCCIVCGLVLSLMIAAPGTSQTCPELVAHDDYSISWGYVWSGGVAAGGNRIFYSYNGWDEYWEFTFGSLLFVDLDDLSLGWSDVGEEYMRPLAATSTHLYLGFTWYNKNLRILDISDPSDPITLVELWDLTAADVALADHYAFVAAEALGLVVLDVTNPASPVEVGSLVFDADAEAVDVDGPTAYLAVLSAGLQIVDVSDPSSPTVIGGLDTPGSAIDVAISPGLAYIADYPEGLRVIDVSDPTAPQELWASPSPANVRSIAYDDGVLYAAQDNFVRVIDVADPSSPVELAVYEPLAMNFPEKKLVVSRGMLAIGYDQQAQDIASFELLDLRGCPVSWWPANGDANDAVGSNHGGVAGGLSFAQGILGQGYHFDGASSSVSVPSSADLAVGTGDFSLVYWVSTTAGADSGFRVIQDKRSAAPNSGYHLLLSDGRPGVQLMDASNVGTFVAPDSIADGSFHQVAITVDRDSVDGGRIFVDRKLVLGFDPSSVPGSLTNGEEFRLGRRSDAWGGDGYFDGIVDEIRFYDRALSEAEVDYNFLTTRGVEIFSDGFEVGTPERWSISVL